jgi:hypothetical protein
LALEGIVKIVPVKQVNGRITGRWKTGPWRVSGRCGSVCRWVYGKRLSVLKALTLGFFEPLGLKVSASLGG